MRMAAAQTVLAGAILAATAWICIVAPPAACAQTALQFHSRIPLGIEALALTPKQTLYVLASAENEQFEGWRRSVTGERWYLTNANGSPVEYYPESISFRVTVSARLKLLEVPAFPIAMPDDLSEYLLRLSFRLKLFRGLNQQIVRPFDVQMIGVPAEIPYDERVYLVSFRLPHIPIHDRCVLEVLSPRGERLAKFHLDVM